MTSRETLTKIVLDIQDYPELFLKLEGYLREIDDALDLLELILKNTDVTEFKQDPDLLLMTCKFVFGQHDTKKYIEFLTIIKDNKTQSYTEHQSYFKF